jgi:hypothetical protein
MKLNVGTTDRIVRAILGFALIAATLAGWSVLWGVVGAILLGTAVVSFCPLYAILGKSTCAVPPPGSKAGAQ